jgi:peptidoglycan/LPS O-acetylase OafA/YrhL
MLTSNSAVTAIGTTDRSGSVARLHSLDGLRALAVGLVVFHHLGVSSFAQTLVKNGYTWVGHILGSLTASGVELFFVLSGVVLLRPYLRDGRRMDIAHYCWRRIVRLYPPFFVAWLLSGLSVWLVWTYPTWWTQVSALPVFDLMDWIKQSGIMYFGNRAHNFAWWSLTVELMFYVCAPAIVILIASTKNAKLAVRCFFAASIVGALLVYPGSWAAGPLALPGIRPFVTYLSSFAAGVFLATSEAPKVLRRSAAILGLFIVGCSGMVDALNVHVGWGLVYFGVVGSAIDQWTRASRTLSNDKLVWLGERSYSIFLTHYAVITIVCLLVSTFVSTKGAVYFIATRVMALLASLLVAMLVFHLVEKRFARNLVTADRLLPWSRAVS